MQCCASSIVSYFDIEDDDNENNDEIGNTLLVDFMICLYQAGSQSEGERIRGRGTYLGENLEPRVIMIMVVLEWKWGTLPKKDDNFSLHRHNWIPEGERFALETGLVKTEQVVFLVFVFSKRFQVHRWRA